MRVIRRRGSYLETLDKREGEVIRIGRREGELLV